MGFTVQVRGGAQCRDLGRRLKTADRHLIRELRRGLLRAAGPPQRAVRAEIPVVMPPGYTPVLSRSLQMRARLRGRTGIRITATARGRSTPRRITALNRGILRHPLFGNREFWFSQSIRPGFWSRPMRASAPAVREELAKALSDAADAITRG